MFLGITVSLLVSQYLLRKEKSVGNARGAFGGDGDIEVRHYAQTETRSLVGARHASWMALRKTRAENVFWSLQHRAQPLHCMYSTPSVSPGMAHRPEARLSNLSLPTIEINSRKAKSLAPSSSPSSPLSPPLFLLPPRLTLTTSPLRRTPSLSPIPYPLPRTPAPHRSVGTNCLKNKTD